MSYLRMHGQKPPILLIASAEPALLARLERAMSGAGLRTENAPSAEAALDAISRPNPPLLLILDADLPGMDPARLLAAASAVEDGLPVLVVAGAVSQEWLDRLKEGVIDDLIPRQAEDAYWELRVERVLRARRMRFELDTLRQEAARNASYDRLTGVLNREATLAALFRETDRVQRNQSPLSVILLDIDDFGHWNSRLGVNICDEMLCQVVARSARLLRSYDIFGRAGKDEFLIGLPGCSTANAVLLTERLRQEVFAEPYHFGSDAVRISACFGIAQSMGRSPVVALREAESALVRARERGPESIECYGSSESQRPPVTFLSPTSGEELLAW